MAFCTSCGASVDAGTKFCPKCGASMSGSGGGAAARPAAKTSPAQPAKGGGPSALKIVLIILGVCLLLGMLAVGGAVYTAYRVAKAAKQQAQQTMGAGGIKIETPTGTVSVGGDDASKPAGPVEVEVYPGAVPEQSTSSVSMGGVSVASAVFTTSDPPSKVADFYRKQYPKTMLFSQQGEHTSMMVNTDKGMVTIVIEPYEGKTKITVAHMAGGSKPEGSKEPN